MECKQPANLKKCNCTYEVCHRKGLCCECITFHLNSRELPACCFPSDAEASYNRSFELFAQLVNAGKI